MNFSCDRKGHGHSCIAKSALCTGIIICILWWEKTHYVHRLFQLLQVKLILWELLKSLVGDLKEKQLLLAQRAMYEQDICARQSSMLWCICRQIAAIGDCTLGNFDKSFWIMLTTKQIHLKFVKCTEVQRTRTELCIPLIVSQPTDWGCTQWGRDGKILPGNVVKVIVRC